MKPNHILNYPIENIFFGIVNEDDEKEKCVLRSIEKEGRKYYAKLHTGFTTDFGTNLFSSRSVEILGSLKEFVEQQELGVLLLDKDMNPIDTVTVGKIDRIKTAAVTKKKLGDNFIHIKKISYEFSQYIADRLGFNLLTNPQTKLIDPRNGKINNIVVKKTQLTKFIEILASYISTELLIRDNVIVTKSGVSMDAFISRAINKCKIKLNQDLIDNNFSLAITRQTYQVEEALLPLELKQEVGKRLVLK